MNRIYPYTYQEETPTPNKPSQIITFWVDEAGNKYIQKLEKENEQLEEENYKLQKCLNEEELDVQDQNRDLGLRIDKAIEYINKLLKEEVEITDEDSIDYGTKCQRAYFSDAELGKILQILGDKENE